MGFQRKIKFHPAFDKRDADLKKNYGVRGLEMQFHLIGPDGGVTYAIITNWMLPHVQKEIDNIPPSNAYPYLSYRPMSGGLSGHWKIPQYKGQNSIAHCEITGGDCYCVGTFVTKDVFDTFISEGEEALWKLLEQRYEDWKPSEH